MGGMVLSLCGGEYNKCDREKSPQKPASAALRGAGCDLLVALTRAFIYAGTPSVIVSLWKVDDSSTAALMGSFYKNLKSMSKVEALRQAQLELIKGEARSQLLAKRGVGGIGKLGETPQLKSDSPNTVSVSISVSVSHPYFWAPFVLVGDGK